MGVFTSTTRSLRSQPAERKDAETCGNCNDTRYHSAGSPFTRFNMVSPFRKACMSGGSTATTAAFQLVRDPSNAASRTPRSDDDVTEKQTPCRNVGAAKTVEMMRKIPAQA